MNRRSFLLSLAVVAAGGCSANRLRRAETRSLRVLTYNVHHGEGVDGRLDLDRIATVIRAASPDLVALQEVDRYARRTGGIDQTATYARLTGLHAWFGAAMPFQGGEYGQALLSRWPLQQPTVLPLPGTRGREPRIVVTAIVDIPRLGRIRLAGLHLDAGQDDGDRWTQAGALLQGLKSDSVRTLLAGDFNATPESRVMQRILAPGNGWVDTAGQWAAPTIPAESPKSRIDFVLASPPAAWQTLKSEVIPELAASDHRPVLVEISLPQH
ncbi:MAG TPA: endonuclease/exonuclease/phosphatase family protein [Verrucomicrobiae bacterium]